MLRLLVLLAALLTPLLGCFRYRDDIEYDFPVESVWNDAVYGSALTLFEGVWWDTSTAQLIQPLLVDQSTVSNRSVLDLFCGPGYAAVICGKENAKSVLSIADSKAAYACARYNVAFHSQDAIVEVRDLDLAVSPILPPTAQYELIFALLADAAQVKSDISIDRKLVILAECARSNLTTSGRTFAVCENEEVATKLTEMCQQHGFTATIHGNRLATASAWELKVHAKVGSQTAAQKLPSDHSTTVPETP